MTTPCSKSTASDDVGKFRNVLEHSQHIVVLAGAGLSAASGIPTFRDGGGMWRSLDATNLATPAAFAENPSLVWQFYHYRRQKALEAKPNEAHILLAKLAVPSYLKIIAPSAKSYHLVTQNVDGLSTVALKILADESTSKTAHTDRVRTDSVLEMHGRLFDVKCTSCNFCAQDTSNPLCASLGTADLEDYHTAGSKPNNIPESDLPRCPSCHSLARPGVVWFGEKPYRLDEINSLIFKADLLIVVGTSLTVYPASSYVYRVQRRGGKVAVFDLDPSERNEGADFHFRGRCEVELSRILGIKAMSKNIDTKGLSRVQ